MVFIQQIKHEFNENLSFNTDKSQLEMDGRFLMVPSSFLNLHVNIQTPTDASSFMSVNREWVKYKDCNIFWFPLNHWPGVYAFQDQTFMLRNRSGRITFFRFNSTITPFIFGIWTIMKEFGRNRNFKILNLYNFRACDEILSSKTHYFIYFRYFEYVAIWTASILYIFLLFLWERKLRSK